MTKGDTGEAQFSKIYHAHNTPVLISSYLLRNLNLGQIDVAYLNQFKQLVIIEVKNSRYPGTFQWSRLRRSQDYLAQVLGIEVKLEVKFCQKAQDSLFF